MPTQHRKPNKLYSSPLKLTRVLSRPITEHDVDAQLMTSLGGSPPLDILIRTSGVKRLSDFLLWQVRNLTLSSSHTYYCIKCSENTQLQFADTYWPNFGLLDFVPILLDYQRKVWSRPSPV